MGRPPNPIGTLGSVVTRPTSSGWEAYGRVRDPDGVLRKILRAGKTEAQAKRNLAAAVRDRVHAGGGEDVTGDTHLKDIADRWYANPEVQALKPRTREQYERVLRVHIKPGIGALRVRELTVGSVSTFLAAVERKHGASTAKMCRSVLSGACAWTAKRVNGWVNPVRDADRISTKPKTPPRSMTLDQLRDLILWAGYDDRSLRRDLPDFIRWMAATGLRIGEAAAVRRCDVDLDARTVAVTGNLVRAPRVGIVRQEDESAKLNPRVLRLPIWAVAMLRARLARRPVADDDPLFPAPQGGWRDPSNTQADLRDLRAFAGYGWVRSHTFRKSVATLMDESGLSARAGADQLGHKNPSMTQDRYWGRQVVDTGAADVLEAIEPGDGDARENGG